MFAPFGVPHNDTKPSWHSEPAFRGTYSILSTCVITLGLCVWTCLHLNIPAYGESGRQWQKKLVWLATGLFAPELVAWTAYEQYKQACELQIFMEELFGQKPNPSFWKKLRQTIKRRIFFSRMELVSSNEEFDIMFQHLGDHPKRKFHWTIVHSYYAVMGGFAVNSSDSDVNFMPSGFPRLTLTLKGLKLVAKNQPDLIPDISEAQIRDKSNADELAKALVCFQAMWFCVQFIFRLAQGLTVTLLELNTTAHAICTLLIYLLWWNKPLDIKEPTTLAGSHHDEMVAYLCVQSKYGACKLPILRPGSQRVSGAAISIHANPSFPGRDAATPTRAHSEQAQPTLQENFCRLNFGSTFHGFQLERAWTSYNVLGEWAYEMDDGHNFGERERLFPGHVDLAPCEIQCLLLAERAIERWKLISDTPLLIYRFGHLETSITDWPSIGELGDEEILEVFVGLSLAGLLYGCLHVSAWMAPFPTPLQGLLWRLSAVTLSISGMIFVLFVGTVDLITRFRDEAKGHFRFYLLWPLGFLYGSLMFTYCLLYSLARLDLVIECFLNLAYIPDSALLLPSWSQYVPHIV